MTTCAPPQIACGRDISARTLVAIWLLAGAALWGSGWFVEAQRSQEARVLETARQMLDQPWPQWLIPRCNGSVRLQKPPLCYWLAAGGFGVFGVSAMAGRTAMILCAWLTLALAYDLGRRMLGSRAAMIGSLLLAGSFLFVRYGRLAETDIVSTFFVTLAVWALWRGMETRAGTSVAMQHLAAIAMGLAALSKGPPAALPLLFLIVSSVVDRRWRPLRRFALSGAPMTLAVVALPWFWHVRQLPEAAVIGQELDRIVQGTTHPKPVWFYGAEFFRATVPWVGFATLAMIAAAVRCRQHAGVRALLVLLVVMLIPLSVVGQKQDHYMLPMMVPIMLLSGWAADAGMNDGGRPRRIVLWIFGATLAAAIMAAPALLVGARLARGRLVAADWIVSAIILLVAAITMAVHRRRGLEQSMPTMAIGGVLIMATMLGPWAKTVQPMPTRIVAEQIVARFAQGPYVFYACEHVPLVFHMRRTMAVTEDEQQLRHALEANPAAVVIWHGDSPAPTVPPELVEQMRFANGDKLTVVWKRAAP